MQSKLEYYKRERNKGFSYLVIVWFMSILIKIIDELNPDFDLGVFQVILLCIIFCFCLIVFYYCYKVGVELKNEREKIMSRIWWLKNAI